MRDGAMRATPAGATLALLIAATTLPVDSAHAQGWSPFFYDEPPARIEPNDIVRRQKPRKKAMQEMRGESRNRPAQAAKSRAAKGMQIPDRKPQGPLTIAISISQQRLKIYDAQGLFAESPVSSGKAGHSTPRGVFSIIQKRKWHRSNLYANAPMPYMQRITWSGVALHAGVLPGYPASHGCVRLPNAFAAQLWTWTRPGARVVITHDELTPAEIAHPQLASLIPTSNQANTEKPAAAPTDKPQDSSRESKQDTKPEAKPESKPETKPETMPEKKADAATGLRLTLADDGELASVLAASASAGDTARVAQASDSALPKPGDKDEFDAGMEEPASTGSASSIKADDAKPLESKPQDSKGSREQSSGQHRSSREGRRG